MPEVHVQVTSTATPAAVLRVLTDFGPSRAEVWPGVDSGHLEVHGEGPGWADVTEGNNIGWERQSYIWDADAGTVSSETTDSNLWAPGSRWDYTITATDDGTLLDIRLLRHGKGVKGKLVGALVAATGKRMLSKQFGQALERAAG